jgi:subtilisin family serine protease
VKLRLLVVLAIAVLAAGLIPAVAFATSSATEQTYLVLYKAGNTPKDAATQLSRSGATIVANYSAIGVVIARSSDPAFANSIRGTSGVEGAAATAAFATGLGDDQLSADEVESAITAPVTDSAEPLWPLQWDMMQINTPDAHAITGGSASVLVGDIDTGLDFTHPDLAPNYDAANSADCTSGAPTPLLPGNDVNGHGTHTAGTIAAAANGIGIVGVAPNVRIAGIKSGNNAGYFFPEAVICGFMWAADHGMKVTNNSYFADPWLFNCANDPIQRAIWKAEQRAINYAQSKGVTVVAAAGNQADDLAHPTQDVTSPDFPPATAVTREVTNACKVVPTEIPGVVSVSATGPTRMKSFYSSYGQGVIDVAAPGGDSRNIDGTVNGRVLSTYPLAAPCLRLVVDISGAHYCYLQGTSMASPHVAGLAALIWSSHPNATQGSVAALLGLTATPEACPDTSLPLYATFPALDNGAPQTCTGGTGNNSFYGAGIVDALSAITH